MIRHVVRNSLTPVLTVLGLHLGTLLGGTVLVEYVFNWPGLSTPLLRAVEARDYPMVVGIVLIISILFLLINLIIDLLYAALIRGSVPHETAGYLVHSSAYRPRGVGGAAPRAAQSDPPGRCQSTCRCDARLPARSRRIRSRCVSRLIWGARTSLTVALLGALRLRFGARSG